MIEGKGGEGGGDVVVGGLGGLPSFIGLHTLRWSPPEAFHRPLAVMLVHKPTRNREIGLVSVIKCKKLSETTIAFSNVKLSHRSSHRENIWIALAHPYKYKSKRLYGPIKSV